MNFKSFYNLLTEDANSTKAEIFNNIIQKELGFQVFKNKNKPENIDSINQLRDKWNPIISSLENIVKNNNPKDKNLSDLKELVRLYDPNIPTNVIDDDYTNYIKYQSLTNNKILQSSSSYIDFSEKVHSEMKGDESKIKAGSSDDPNKVYEDDKVIVVLANTGDPVSSENNCKNYGKGSDLCISGSSSFYYYNFYRWEKSLTTYFVWLKSENRYILVDAYDDNGVTKYSYNNVKDNTDIKSTKNKIISTYPSLSEAFNQNVFVPVPIEGREKQIYEKIYFKNSILELQNIDDMILFASIKNVINDDLYKLSEKELKAVLKTLSEKENDLPHDLLEKFPIIKNRYWKKREINVIRKLEERSDLDDEEKFTLDEYYIISENKDLKELFIQKSAKYREIFSLLYNLQKHKNLSDIYWNYKYPLSLPNLKESGNISAPIATSLSLSNLEKSGDIDASNATSLSLPNLKESGDIDASNATSLSLPNLKESGVISATYTTSLSLSNLEKSGDIYAVYATSLSLPNLKESGVIYASSATSLSLPNLEKSRDISAPNATSLSLPNLEKSGGIDVAYATSLSLPNLEKSGDISASNATSLSLPNLKESGNISAPIATSLSLSNLEKSGNISAPIATSLSLSNLEKSGNPNLEKSGDIYASNATSLSFPNLKESGNISATYTTSLSLPNLEKSGDISASNATSLSLPNLEKSGDIYAPNATSLSFPNLKESGNISATYTTSLSFPNLEKSGVIYATYATSLSLPNLEKSEDIDAFNVENLVISNYAKKYFIKLPINTKIIKNKIKKNYSFRDFFYSKII